MILTLVLLAVALLALFIIEPAPPPRPAWVDEQGKVKLDWAPRAAVPRLGRMFMARPRRRALACLGFWVQRSPGDSTASARSSRLFQTDRDRPSVPRHAESHHQHGSSVALHVG
jgi:hypothetical protein